jgi:hypothetical protein
LWEWRTTKGHFQIKGPLKAMDDFEAAAEEWDNVIEIVPTFAKGQEISEVNFLVLIFKNLHFFAGFYSKGLKYIKSNTP